MLSATPSFSLDAFSSSWKSLCGDRARVLGQDTAVDNHGCSPCGPALPEGCAPGARSRLSDNRSGSAAPQAGRQEGPTASAQRPREPHPVAASGLLDAVHRVPVVLPRAAPATQQRLVVVAEQPQRLRLPVRLTAGIFWGLPPSLGAGPRGHGCGRPGPFPPRTAPLRPGLRAAQRPAATRLRGTPEVTPRAGRGAHVLRKVRAPG